MKNKLKKLKCKISNNHEFTTFAIYHTRRVEIQKCDKCGQRKEIPFGIKK
jgi:hypothetical protein